MDKLKELELDDLEMDLNIDDMNPNWESYSDDIDDDNYDVEQNHYNNHPDEHKIIHSNESSKFISSKLYLEDLTADELLALIKDYQECLHSQLPIFNAFFKHYNDIVVTAMHGEKNNVRSVLRLFKASIAKYEGCEDGFEEYLKKKLDVSTVEDCKMSKSMRDNYESALKCLFGGTESKSYYFSFYKLIDEYQNLSCKAASLIDTFLNSYKIQKLIGWHSRGFEDGYYAAYLGIVDSLATFDLNKKAVFATYANYLVKKNVSNAKHAQYPIHLNKDRLDQILKVIEDAYREGIDISNEEIAKKIYKEPLNKHPEKLAKYTAIVALYRAINDGLISLDKPLGEDDEETIGDYTSGKNNIEEYMHSLNTNEELEYYLSKLSYEDLLVITLLYEIKDLPDEYLSYDKFGTPKEVRYKNVAQYLGVSESTVRRKENHAIKVMQQNL